MTSEGSSQPPARPARINTPGGMWIRDLEAGTKIKLTNGSVVEVVMNAKDGGWLLGRYLENTDDPDLVGEEDWIYFGDVNSEVV